VILLALLCSFLAGMFGGFIGLVLYDLVYAFFVCRKQRRAYRDSHSPYGINDGRYYLHAQRQFLHTTPRPHPLDNGKVLKPYEQFDGQGSVDE
jgi:hypothetical protein